MINKVLNKNNLRALYGGLIATFITGAGIFLLGNLSGYKAKVLLDGSMPSLTMMCNTTALASATIMALLLTLLGISAGSKNKFNENHYQQILLISRWNAAVFIASIIAFQFFNIPITETKEVEYDWWKWIYWASLAISAVLGGAIISIILLLYNTIKNMIKVVGIQPSEEN